MTIDKYNYQVKEFDQIQMYEIRMGLKNGLSEDRVALYAVEKQYILGTFSGEAQDMNAMLVDTELNRELLEQIEESKEMEKEKWKDEYVEF